ncbi:MAG TPA: glycerate kinase [Acidimicrobiales bacterium]|nr:glycerate kinase [Acidimicrobiales bacterium]
MRVVLAPDCFTGTASAAEAATALAAGWRSVAPADSLVLRPVSDGGPGLVDTLAASLPGSRTPVPGLLLAAGVGYVESAVGCGPQAMAAAGRDVRTGSTDAVGRLVAAAAAMAGVHTVVVGLGGSATNDGGAGLWAALGAEPADPLLGGGIGLSRVSEVSVPALPGVRLVAATDVDNPLLGLYGASAVYGPQKGADDAAIMALDIALERWADVVEAATAMPGLRSAPGAGAAGGLGFGLLALGAERTSGIDLVLDAIGLAAEVAGADLLVTGEGRYDATSLRGKAVSGVAAIAQQAGVPCVVAAGQADIGAREAAAHGLDEVWTVAEQLGSADAAIRAGADGLTVLGAALARTWSR